MSFNPNKCKVQLKLAVGRLKLLQAKKASLNKQAARELAELLAKRKEESARIRVEHVIREDLNMEAMEILELYCELLLARFGLLEQMKQCDQGISEAVNTIIYAAPRSEVKELQLVRDQLILKYGRDFAVAAMENRHNLVNPRVISKMTVETPEPNLVDKYLETIAAEYKVGWKPANYDDIVDEIESSADEQAMPELLEPAAPIARSTQTEKAQAVSGVSTSSGSAKYPTPKFPHAGSGYQADSPKQPYYDHHRARYQQHTAEQHPPSQPLPPQQQYQGPQLPQPAMPSPNQPNFPSPPPMQPGATMTKATLPTHLPSPAYEPIADAEVVAAGVSGWQAAGAPQAAETRWFSEGNPTAPVDEQVPPYVEDTHAVSGLPPEKSKDSAECGHQPSTGEEDYDDLAKRLEALKHQK